MKKISVIIPCYKCKNVIEYGIESIINQTIGIENIEIILVNDASPDQSGEILREIEQRYPEQVLVIECDQNQGQSPARNLGIQYASGEFITFMDQDDWIHPKMYERMYDNAKKYDCEMVCAKHICITERKISDEPEIGDYAMFSVEREDQRRTLLLSSTTMVGSCFIWDKIYSRKFLIEHEIHFPDNKLLSEDFFFMELVKLYIRQWYIMPDVFYYWYQHNGGTYLHRDQPGHLDRLEICNLLLEEYKNRNLYEKFYEEIEASYIKNYYLSGLHSIYTRFNNMPVERIGDMKEQVEQIFPNWRNNEYLQNDVIRSGLLGIKGWTQKFYSTLFQENTEEELRKLGENYWNAVKDSYTILE